MNAPCSMPVWARPERVDLNPRSPLRSPDAPDTEAFAVLGGVLGLYALDARGQRQIVGLLFPGDTLFPGQRSGCGLWPLTRGAAAVATLTEAEMAASEPECVRAAGRALAIAYQWLALCRVGKTERLAHLLCEIAVRGEYNNTLMPILLTQATLGDITGQTNVNVNRAMADLERRGFIAREQTGRANGTIAFRNWDGLCEFAGFDASYLQVTL